MLVKPTPDRRRRGFAYAATIMAASAWLERVGLVRWQEDCSRSHVATAESLINEVTADAVEIAGQIGHQPLEELLAAHPLWSDWLRDGRIRKIALVAEKTRAAEMPT